MSPDDVEYYRQRAVFERALAETITLANVAAIHEELARQYEALVAHAELRDNLNLPTAWKSQRFSKEEAREADSGPMQASA